MGNDEKVIDLGKELKKEERRKKFEAAKQGFYEAEEPLLFEHTAL